MVLVCRLYGNLYRAPVAFAAVLKVGVFEEPGGVENFIIFWDRHIRPVGYAQYKKGSTSDLLINSLQ